jgi:bacterial leucyl aminopeptidase
MTSRKNSGFVAALATTVTAVCALSATAMAAPQTKAVLADEAMLLKAGVKVLATEKTTGVAYGEITAEQEKKISMLAHEAGKCGGFEMLPSSTHKGLSSQNPLLTAVFGQLAEREAINKRFTANSSHFSTMMLNPTIAAAVEEVNPENLKKTVAMMSSFSNRTYNGSKPNDGVNALKSAIETTVQGSTVPVQVELVDHRSIGQKSIRARIVGSKRPNEIIVLGAHLDSINQDWFGSKAAPGADDNASGSSNIMEALRIISHQASAPERTIEFMWYAGEEGGLIGSAEIASDYKAQGKDVVGVLQLDMTLFPGDGAFTLGSMTDFTSAWLRSYFENLNSLYVKAKIVNDKCGYGCSDHASWNRQGYPALMPFESSFDRMNHNLHTAKDVIDSNSNFEHAAVFSKIAVAMALDLGNSELREPK